MAAEAPDKPLVDPETGITAPLSPARKLSVTQAYDRARCVTLDQFINAAALSSVPEATRKAWLYGDWEVAEAELDEEPDDAP